MTTAKVATAAGQPDRVVRCATMRSGPALATGGRDEIVTDVTTGAEPV